MEIKKYSEYIKEDDSQNKMNTIKAIYLISKNGEIVEKNGFIIFGKGILDEDNKSWVAAIGEDMKLYSNINDNNTLFTVVNINKYNPESSPSWKNSGESI